jgi:hypothetical protein
MLAHITSGSQYLGKEFYGHQPPLTLNLDQAPLGNFRHMRNMNLVGKSQKTKENCVSCAREWVKSNKHFFNTHPAHHIKLQWHGFDHGVFVRVGGWEWPWARRHVENYSSCTKIFRWPSVMKIFQWPWKIAHHLKSNLKFRYFNLSIKEKLFSFVYHVEIPLWLHPLLHLK